MPHETSIKRRLIVLFAVIAGFALLISSSAFLSYEWVVLRKTLVRTLDTQAVVLARTMSRGIAAGDRNEAEEALGSLQADPHIRAACVYLPDGTVFAAYPRGTRSYPPLPSSGDSFRFKDDSLELFHSISLGGRDLGHVFIRSDLNDIQSRFTFAALMLLGLLILVFGFVLLAAYVLQKQISAPILALADSARRISQERDYSIRLARSRGGEIGALTDALNDMLEQIRSRDLQLLDDQDHLEEQVAQRSEQLLRANTQLLLAKEAAEEANRTKSLFLANMSHELRTPLNAILLYSELLVDEIRERGIGDLVGDLDKIQNAGKHLLSLIDDILDLSKIEAGRMTVFLEDCSIPALLPELATTIEPLIAKNQNRLLLEIDRSAGVVHTDIKKLRQIIYNLLHNASKFTQNGTIVLGARMDPDDDHFVRFSITDSGIGMNPGQVRRIFHEFTQGDESTTRKYGGTGLGLTLCSRFVGLLGGQIEVQSEEGKGSTFTVRLPRNATPTAARTAALKASASPLHRGKVLIIDDDPSLRDAVSRMLTKEGFWVAVASCGEDGLKMAKSLHPDVITLDIAMPGLDGWQVLSSMKQDPDIQSIPVLIVTIMEDRAKGFALGASEYLQKPISKEQLLSALARVLPEQPASLLIVEDDEATQEGLRRILASEGIQTRCALDGSSALDQLRAEPPSLILLDLMLPGMDGFQLIAEMQSSEAWRNIPVIVLTAKDLTREDLERLSRPQVHKVFRKGACSREELLDAVRTFAIRVTGPPVTHHEED